MLTRSPVTEIEITQDEARLAQQASDDPDAFIALYDQYFAKVYNYIRYRCEDAETCDDLTAALFERALASIRQYNPKRAPFGAWLFAIARNTVNAHLRAQLRRPVLPLEMAAGQPDQGTSPEEALIAIETENELLLAMEHLSDRERDLLGLKFAARLTNRRIAEIVRLTESNVGIIIYRAIDKLRGALAE
jgi:RNA polymerase sigma-70 factor (ECF subfamily)